MLGLAAVLICRAWALAGQSEPRITAMAVASAPTPTIKISVPGGPTEAGFMLANGETNLITTEARPRSVRILEPRKMNRIFAAEKLPRFVTVGRIGGLWRQRLLLAVQNEGLKVEGIRTNGLMFKVQIW